MADDDRRNHALLLWVNEYDYSNGNDFRNCDAHRIICAGIFDVCGSGHQFAALYPAWNAGTGRCDPCRRRRSRLGSVRGWRSVAVGNQGNRTLCHLNYDPVWGLYDWLPYRRDVDLYDYSVLCLPADVWTIDFLSCGTDG